MWSLSLIPNPSMIWGAQFPAQAGPGLPIPSSQPWQVLGSPSQTEFGISEFPDPVGLGIPSFHPHQALGSSSPISGTNRLPCPKFPVSPFTPPLLLQHLLAQIFPLSYPKRSQIPPFPTKLVWSATGTSLPRHSHPSPKAPTICFFSFLFVKPLKIIGKGGKDPHEPPQMYTRF